MTSNPESRSHLSYRPRIPGSLAISAFMRVFDALWLAPRNDSSLYAGFAVLSPECGCL
jgi:hypothetical protein